MKSGIYIIWNKKDSRVYIGSAVNIAMRKGTHFFQLRNNKHHNNYLQRFFNKYGEGYLKFEVLEKCEKEILLQREQFYLNKYKNKFNLCKIAGNSLNRHPSEATKKKISKALKNAGLKGRKKSIETRIKMTKPKSKRHALHIKEAQSKVRRQVYQYNFSLELINIFESISEASDKTGFNRQQISACCNENKQNSVKKYLFTFIKITDLNYQYFVSKVNKTLNKKNKYNSNGITLHNHICPYCKNGFKTQCRTSKYCSVLCRAKAINNFKVILSA